MKPPSRSYVMLSLHLMAILLCLLIPTTVCAEESKGIEQLQQEQIELLQKQIDVLETQNRLLREQLEQEELSKAVGQESSGPGAKADNDQGEAKVQEELVNPKLRPAEEQEMKEAKKSEKTRTISINSRSQFACAEVKPDSTGGRVRHEITLSPKTIERCLLSKVGSRLHDCEKLKIRTVAADQNEVVMIDTDKGAVHFWFEEKAKISSADGTGTVVFSWPGTDSTFGCLPFR